MHHTKSEPDLSVDAAAERQAPQRTISPFAQLSFSAPFWWPFLPAALASESMANFVNGMAKALAKDRQEPADLPAPQWATPNKVALELESMRLRDFSTQAEGRPTLICAPYALHCATIADFAQGHSLVEALRGAGLARVFVTDWRSATPEMRYFSIDTYLADINVAVDELGPPVDLVGLCQGGWMALVYAARFPAKVNRLVLAGAPVDIRAGESQVSRLATEIPLSMFENLIHLGNGRVLGRHVLEFWAPALAANEADRILQISPDGANSRMRDLEKSFQEWNDTTVDLPGTYYLQVVRRVFKENQIAEGHFVALGRPIDLAEIRMPIFLLAARDDELVAVEQLFATARLVGTPRGAIQMATEPCSHLSLFLGRKTLTGPWRRIANWLQSDMAVAMAS
jgi:poly(3-hydroxyalkanoate) synthetase